MNGKILIRTAFLSCFCLVLFANTPGFGKLNLQNHNTTINGFTRITDEKILNFRKEKFGFELHCACAPVKEAGMCAEENRGLVATEFIE
jgi:hypothetical protein